MSKFLTGKELEDAIYDIIWEAEEKLLIVSPFIKLDDYFKKLFDRHENNPKVHLLLVFGKNEKEVKKSMSKADFDYFKKFPNVSIIYVSNLHAKYYGNEIKGVISSINLYDYSFKNNIEFGVYSQQSLMNKIKQSADNDAWNTCLDIADENEVVFIKRPVYEKSKMIINLGKKYVKSEVLVDSTERFYGNSKSSVVEKKRLPDFPVELELDDAPVERPDRSETELQEFGFCIRTGKKIKFNPKQPMSREAWKIWNEYKNEDFPEKYCHKTGEPSNGKTSMKNPILK
ncbi:phospholipase D family protein [Gilvibacter sediminis]|uniref:phospholipase D family protein n=1 Tax=Gilvibacter sediminis TaxID=379071 RepID=UPI00235064C3|nr:phospholipase D family protein [Gilvibacter sediminis]MDC7996635.1 phospholipase D family protein [Gilvibacter sediminis]